MDRVQQSPYQVNSTSPISIRFQGKLVEARYVLPPGSPGRPDRVGGKRNVVNEFSAASRRRLLKLFASLDVYLYKTPPIFLTLTYPAEFPSPKVAKRNLRAFLEFLRRIDSNTSAVWRFDFQQRGAPHFHLLLFNLPWLSKELIQKVWGRIIGFDEPFTKIEAVKNSRHLMSYVSHYVAKVDSSHGGFNLLAYLHENEFIHPQTGEKCGSVGRWWGVFNAADLPFAQAVVIAANAYKAFWSFKRGARKKFNRVNKNRTKGFFIFVNDARRWMDYWFAVLVDGA